MAVYNSFFGLNRDDHDGTITDQVNSSGPVVRRLQETNIGNRQDYVYLDQNRQETAEQIQQILSYYRQELKQKSNTQLDCSRQLITRLIDFIRPVYSSNKNKMTDLDILFEEIAASHHARFIEQKEKTEQLNNEISHFKKLIITSTNEDNSSNNTMTRIYRINSMVDYEQWMEMEEETRKLHNLVELQRDRINELIKLISNEEVPPRAAVATHKTIIASCNEVPINKQQSTASNINGESTFTTRIVDGRQNSGMDISQRSINEFHSSGTSPSHSLTDFLTKPFVDTENNKTQNDEQPPVVICKLSDLSRKPSTNNDKKTCCICNHEFPSTANEYELISHLQRCLSTVGIDDLSGTIEHKQYGCPNCLQQFPGDDEKAYIQHVTDCYGQPTDTF